MENKDCYEVDKTQCNCKTCLSEEICKHREYIDETIGKVEGRIGNIYVPEVIHFSVICKFYIDKRYYNLPK